MPLQGALLIAIIPRAMPWARSFWAFSPYLNHMRNFSPIIFIDPDGKGIWTKIGKAVIKVGSKVARNGLKALSQTATYTNAFSDVVNETNTLTSEKASKWDKLKAGVSLASELLPISINDVKDVYKFAKNGKRLFTSSKNIAKKIRPNSGIAPPHGGKEHNNKIDNLIDRLQRDPGVSNIRKNQQQVDIQGNTVGKIDLMYSMIKMKFIQMLNMTRKIGLCNIIKMFCLRMIQMLEINSLK